MCKVKTGEQVQTTPDLQNLVTSTILRQTQPFTAGSIEDQVATLLEGSPFLQDVALRPQVAQICERTLQYMLMSRGIRSVGMDSDLYRLALAFPSYNPAMMHVG